MWPVGKLFKGGESLAAHIALIRSLCLFDGPNIPP